MHLAALAAELEAEVGAGDLDVAVLESGESEGAVGLGVLVVAHPDAGALEQPDHRGKNLFAGKSREAEVALQPRPDLRQRLAEAQHSAELGLVPDLPPLGMIAVLLPPSRVPSGGLDVSVGAGADPHVGVCRRNRQRANPGQLLGVTNRLPVRCYVHESLAGPLPADPRLSVAHIA